MRILQVHTRYRHPGGEDVAVDAERRSLEAAGHEVRLHADANPAGRTRTALALLGAPWNPFSARSVRTTIDSFHPDVAHIHNTWFAHSPSVVVRLRQAGVPTVMSLHNYRLFCSNAVLFRDGAPCVDCVGTTPVHGVVHRCYHDSLAASGIASTTIGLHQALRTWERHVDDFLTPSESARQLFIAGGLPPERLHVKPHSVPDPGTRERPPSASKVVLAVGRLSAERGIETLVRAWSQAGIDDLELVVVGEGPLRSRLEAMAAGNVRFTGPLDANDVRGLMLTARALLFPTQWFEPFGLVVAESMAAGLPVVGSDIGAVPEIIGEEGGWLVPPGRVDRWADLFNDVLTHDHLIDDRGTGARQRFESRFSERMGLIELESAYRRARTRGR
jgi:glycosyltransferase involved in cell wall biosynthesis